MKEIALKLGFKEEDLKGLTEPQIKEKVDEAIKALQDPDKQIAALAKDGFTIKKENPANVIPKDGETKPAKTKADEDEGEDEDKKAKNKKVKDDDDEGDEPVTRAEHVKLKKAHDKLQDCHDKLQAAHDKLEDRVKNMEDKFTKKAKAEDEDKAKNYVEALVKSGRIVDTPEAKAGAVKNLLNDFAGYSEVYKSLPETKKPTPDVNAILNIAAAAKTDKPAVKKNLIADAMKEANENEKKITNQIAEK